MNLPELTCARQRLNQLAVHLSVHFGRQRLEQLMVAVPAVVNVGLLLAAMARFKRAQLMLH